MTRMNDRWLENVSRRLNSLASVEHVTAQLSAAADIDQIAG
jgi:hypothetical protein